MDRNDKERRESESRSYESGATSRVEPGTKSCTLNTFIAQAEASGLVKPYPWVKNRKTNDDQDR